MAGIRAAVPADAGAIAAIWNQGIEDRSATFETEPRTAADLVARLGAGAGAPLLVACGADGRVLGWAGIGQYRPRACYAGVGDFSLYLDRAARGRGIGRQLLVALVDAAAGRGYWKLLSRVFVSNAASRAVCRSAGFREVGLYEKHAKLDGHWRDVVVVERLIPRNLT